MSDKYSMSGEHHLQQFHNAEDYLDNEAETRTMWWDMPQAEESQRFASGGSVISQLRKRRPENDIEPIHPAMRIPGVHIRTAEAGEPFFNGDK